MKSGWHEAINAALILAFITMLVICLLPQSAYADPGLDWYNANWPYRKSISISGSTSEQTNYQVKVTVSFVTGKMNSDFSDVRFTSSNGTTLIDHWRESFTASTAADFWVEVPSIPTSGTTIYMYYGNSGASSASDGTSTFVFFDDFLGTSLDTDKWDSWDANVSVSSSVVTITNTAGWGGIGSKTAYSLPYIFVARVQKTTTLGTGEVGLQTWYNGTGDVTLNVFAVSTGLPQAYSTSKYDGDEQWDEVGTWTVDTWYHYEIKGKQDEVKYHRDGELKNTVTTTTAIPAGTMTVLFGSQSNNDELLVDYCFICNYVSPEPSADVGSEEKHWESYSDSEYSTQCDYFDEYPSENIIYMYGKGFGDTINYRVWFWDGSGVLRGPVDTSSDSSGNLSAAHTLTFGTDIEGDWHCSVYDDQTYTPPSYNPNDTKMVADDTSYDDGYAFYVDAIAIPEFPTVLTVIVVMGLCAGIYLWMRKRRMPRVKA